MKKLLATLGLGLLFIAQSSMAEVQNKAAQLNTMRYQRTLSEWAVSQTARVVVGVNATLKGADVAKVRANILKKLANLQTGAPWHVTQFSLAKDQSGLTQIRLQAEARIENSKVDNLQSRVNSASKAGEKITVVNIDFSPSERDIEKLTQNLRLKLYQSVLAEIKQLNGTGSKHYFIHQMLFGHGSVYHSPMLMKMAVAPSAGGLAVSRKVMVSANVVLANTIK